MNSVSNRFARLLMPVLSVFVLCLFIPSAFAETSSQPATKPNEKAGGGTVGGTGTVMPDLFTGTMSYSIPIEVPAGRKGIQPNLALTYRSNNGNGWVGVGWNLEVGAIERSARNGINYTGDDFVLRMDGAAIDLVNIGGDEYRAKIESGFLRIKKLSATDGKPYWEVTDKAGTRYYYCPASDGNGLSGRLR